MKTDNLIAALTADAGQKRPNLSLVLLGIGLVAVALAMAVFFGTIGPRADIAAAAGTVRFVFKFVVTLALAGGGFWLFARVLRPGAARTRDYLALALAPGLLGLAVVIELSVLPSEVWAANLVGSNARNCLTFIPLMGIGPLALFLIGVRHGAPTRPMLAGVIAGVLAGSIAATFYAANCTDDSPLFVATWYPIAIGGLALVGSLAARALARW